MRTRLVRLTTLCAAAVLLSSCAQVARQRPAPPVAGADDAYRQGRSAHLAEHYEQAVALYQAALQADPAHVNASNGLAAAYAEKGELGKAIELWQRLTAASGANGPAGAYLLSNLGYAYFLNGDYERALAALERACVLDPLNPRAWRNLGAALGKLGKEERAQLMYKQAGALERHDFKTDYALARRAGVAAIDSAVAVAVAPAADDWAASELRQTASGVYELLRPATAVSMAAQSVAGAAALPSAERTRLEVANGNGVHGMARLLALELGASGKLLVVRVTNHKGFNVQQTRVEYQPPFRAAAAELAERVGSAAVVEVANYKSADMRLVIGHDLAQRKAGQEPARAALAARNSEAARRAHGKGQGQG